MNPKQLDQLTQGLIESYELYPTRADQGEPLPSFEAIVGIIEEVRRLLFPGFYAEEHLPSVGREYRVGHWLTRLHQTLTRVLSLALSHERSVRSVHKHELCDDHHHRSYRLWRVQELTMRVCDPLLPFPKLSSCAKDGRQRKLG